MNKEDLVRIEELQSVKFKAMSDDDIALWLRRYSEIWLEIISTQRQGKDEKKKSDGE